MRAATERLSSGLRINHAADDAAGLAIASSLNADSRVYTTGIRNLNDGISLLSMADASLESLSNITIRIRELSEQAANGTLSFTQRKSLNSEANSLATEFNRILATTSFNGRQLLNLSDSSLRLQAGYGVDGGIGISLGDQLSRSTGTGSFGSRTAIAAASNPTNSRILDIDKDGDNDLLFGLNAGGSFGVMLNDGAGNLSAQVSYAGAGAAGGFNVADVNGDGKLDALVSSVSNSNLWVALGNGDGTFQALTDTGRNIGGLSLEVGDFNNDGLADVAGSAVGTGLVVTLGQGDGSFAQVASFAASGSATLRQHVIVDFNHDGNLDVVGTTLSTAVDVFYGDGAGSFSRSTLTVNDNATGLSVSDFDGDGRYDIAVAYNNTSTHGQVETFRQQADGSLSSIQTFGSAVSSQQMNTADVNGDGIMDMLATNTTNSNLMLLIGNGDGTFTNSTLAAGGTTNNAAIGDINGDGAADIFARESATSFARFLGQPREVTTLQRLDLFDAASARGTLDLMQNTLERVTKERAALGAAASRVETALSVLWTSRANTEAAASQIMDADIAIESANAVKSRILQNIAAAILGQANQQTNIIRDLLKIR